MARAPVKYEIPSGTPAAACKGCGAAIAWVKTPAGRAMPVDADGTPHWATCPQAPQFKRARQA
jgi:hypothetical protein